MANPSKDRRPSAKLPKPRFKADERELWLGDQLVKQFRGPADAQETILLAFEELHWAKIIDDPLPHVAGQDPKRRLHHAIRNLNRNQKEPLLHFFGGDGEESGVGAERVVTPELRQSYASAEA